jgi:hypothetical protein
VRAACVVDALRVLWETWAEAVCFVFLEAVVRETLPCAGGVVRRVEGVVGFEGTLTAMRGVVWKVAGLAETVGEGRATESIICVGIIGTGVASSVTNLVFVKVGRAGLAGFICNYLKILLLCGGGECGKPRVAEAAVGR